MPVPEREPIAWLGEASAPDGLGGKGASLDRLLRMGFRVPPGFCLTVGAYRAERGRAPGVVHDGISSSLGAAIDAALERLSRELAEAGIFGPRFAVRSSAIDEDGSVASYAGLHETELDLEAREVPAAVARCWASLWSPAAVAYRARRGLPADDAAMAVVVQALVPADESAVVFTRHPVTGRGDQVVVTAVRGLGDAMVAGTVTPDTYVVDKATRSTVELEPGEDPAGPSLDQAALGDLVGLAIEVEVRFGRAVDIEAARAAGRWYLLQARPITTGSPAAAERPA